MWVWNLKNITSLLDTPKRRGAEILITWMILVEVILLPQP